MRRRFVYDGFGNAVELTGDGHARMHFIQPEITPYKSMIDGSVIDSRSKHEEHLRRHGYRVVEPSEVTPDRINEYATRQPDVSPEKRKELIRAQIDAMPHEKFRAAIKRDIDRVKWNSNR